MEKHRYNLNPHIKHHKVVAWHGHFILPHLGKRQDLTPFCAADSRFDATVWKDAGGKTYVSMTGSQPTELFADFITDIDLSGAAA